MQSRLRIARFCGRYRLDKWNSLEQRWASHLVAGISCNICRIARMYRAVTRNIEVVVTPRFVADRSSPENDYFFWAYTVCISNKGAETVQLKTRHWRITDAHGRRQEVRGAGVVGEEPVLKAGESFEYTSGVPLQTSSGFMVGTYRMVTAGGEHFEIEIPAFSLDSGDSKRTIN